MTYFVKHKNRSLGSVAIFKDNIFIVVKHICLYVCIANFVTVPIIQYIVLWHEANSHSCEAMTTMNLTFLKRGTQYILLHAYNH